MMENNSTSVAAAFEMLLEEIEAEIDFVKQVGARDFERRDYDKAKEAIGRAEQLTDFRDKADALRQEWENLFAKKRKIRKPSPHGETSDVCAVDSGRAKKPTTGRFSKPCKPWVVRLR